MIRPEGSRSAIDVLSKCDSVLDIGCGYGPHICSIKAKKRVGIDISEIPLKVVRNRPKGKGINFIQMDVRNILEKFGENSFEGTIGFDIVEHLTKKDGIQLIEDAEKVATHLNFWYMPAGWFEIIDEDLADGNMHKQHQAAWEPEDLTSRGYEVWHYSDWYRDRKNNPENSSIRAMFAVKVHDTGRGHSFEPGKLHKLHRFPEIGNE